MQNTGTGDQFRCCFVENEGVAMQLFDVFPLVAADGFEPPTFGL